jgi:casein kinase II subunit beta
VNEAMSSDTSSNAEESWIQWHCSLTGNNFFCEVERGFIEDSFNLFGLKQFVNDYSKALDIILDRLRTHEIESEELSRSASVLYGLIHARYIVTSNGLEMMVSKR